MGKNRYSSEVKWAVVKAKMSGEMTNQELMDKYQIKNVTQIKTWMKWYRNGEIHRFDQPLGKQYSYGLGPEDQTADERKDRQIDHLKMENAILKKYMEIEKELKKKS